MFLEGLKILKSLNSKNGLKAYNAIKNCDTITQEDLKKMTNLNFQKMVTYCYENVPFYRDLLNDKKYLPSDFNDTKYITEFPILTKEVLRTNLAQFSTIHLQSIKYSSRRSGGTTGEPIPALIS